MDVDSNGVGDKCVSANIIDYPKIEKGLHRIRDADAEKRDAKEPCRALGRDAMHFERIMAHGKGDKRKQELQDNVISYKPGLDDGGCKHVHTGISSFLKVVKVRFPRSSLKI